MTLPLLYVVRTGPPESPRRQSPVWSSRYRAFVMTSGPMPVCWSRLQRHGPLDASYQVKGEAMDDFEGFVRARGDALLRYAYLLTGDHGRSQDLVQTALAKAYRRWGRVSRSDDPEAYVKRIISNARIDFLRRRSAHEHPTATFAEHGEQDVTGRVGDRDELRQALAGLTRRARTVVVMRYYLDWDDQRIADALDISPITVRTTSMRALESLRNQMITTDGGPVGNQRRAL